MSAPIIWWVRRDLRLADNPALAAALARADAVLPCFVVDPRLTRSPLVGAQRLGFLWGGLRALDAALRARGGRLIVRTGEPLAVLTRLRAETGAAAIVAEPDFSPYARARDRRVAAALPLELVGAPVVHHPAAVRTAAGAPFTVFTPFYRAWRARPAPSPTALPAAPRRVPVPATVASEPLPEPPAASLPLVPGEEAAQRQLAAFVRDGLARYAEARDRLDGGGSARVSPYLRFGMLSARQAVTAALAASEEPAYRRGAEAWVRELAWREFYVGVLYHFPHLPTAPFHPEYAAVRWRDAPDELAAWQEGRTGYPAVDAAMRQLRAEGWLANRARLVAASFLVKDLLLDWRQGERWFRHHLLDGDPAANVGNWQWVAGVGTDAAPYFRVFNPVLQGRKFDPDGTYVRRWVPELARVPPAYLHAPWEMPRELQAQVGCRIGRDYPAPLVDHEVARRRALAAFERARAAAEPRG